MDSTATARCVKRLEGSGGGEEKCDGYGVGRELLSVSVPSAEAARHPSRDMFTHGRDRTTSTPSQEGAAGQLLDTA